MQTVYYSYIVDHYEWVIADYIAKKASYIVFSKKSMQVMIENSFRKLYSALVIGSDTVYNGIDAECIETYIEELPTVLFASNEKHKKLMPNDKESVIQEVSFECAHRAYDIEYTLNVGGHKIKSYISDWSTSLRLLRYQLIEGNNIELYYEDSPTIISFPHRSDYNYEPIDMVEIVPDKFTGGPIIYGYCFSTHIVKAIYEGLLRMARFEFKDPEFDMTWGNMDNMTFYNKIKSPTIEDIIMGRRIVNDIVECRQVLVRHVITIHPCKDYLCIDEKGRKMPLIDKDGKIVISYKDTDDIEIEIPHFKEWYDDFLNAIKQNDSTLASSINYEEWETLGVKYAQSLRSALPDSIDLWYQPPKKDRTKQNDKAILMYKPYRVRM